MQHHQVGVALLEKYCGELDDAREAITDRYISGHSRLADNLQDLIEEKTPVPNTLFYYIDYWAMARDGELNGEFFALTTAFDVVHGFAGC